MWDAHVTQKLELETRAELVLLALERHGRRGRVNAACGSPLAVHRANVQACHGRSCDDSQSSRRAA
jgi:hypothetical protein